MGHPTQTTPSMPSTSCPRKWNPGHAPVRNDGLAVLVNGHDYMCISLSQQWQQIELILVRGMFCASPNPLEHDNGQQWYCVCQWITWPIHDPLTDYQMAKYTIYRAINWCRVSDVMWSWCRRALIEWNGGHQQQYQTQRG